MIDGEDRSLSADRDADDPRFVMATMAARRARRNRPRRLVILSGLILLAAGVLAIWGSAQRAAAAAALREARIEQAAVEQLVPQYQEAAARGEASPYTPVTDLVTRMQTYAREAGLDNPLPSAPTSDAPRGDITETTIRINNIQNQRLEPVMRWLARVTGEIPGVEINQLEITPNDRGWNVNVVFVKPTRRQG